MRLFLPLGPRADPELEVLVKVEPKLLVLLRTLVVGLDGAVKLSSELERSLT